MNIFKYSLTFIIILTYSLASYGQNEQEEALKLGYKAVEMIDNGKQLEAIDLLKQAKKLDPENIDYTYEIAYAYYTLKEYKKAIKILKKITQHKDATDLYYQLMGNAYDYLEKPDEALEVYKEGLDKFPNSGKLYLEQGIVEFYRENYSEAVNYWEKGVVAEPNFSSNYFWLGKVFSQTDERIWAVLYGEIFMNIERNSKRTVEMSNILFNTYNNSIYTESNTSGGVSFSKDAMQIDASSFDPSKGLKFPFPMIYELTMLMGLDIESLNEEENISLKSINDLRHSFINNWFEQEKEKEYPNLLFNFHKDLKDKGFLEPYTYWLLMKGKEDEFSTWANNNEEIFDQFVEWFTNNPLEINKDNFFSRLNY